MISRVRKAFRSIVRARGFFVVTVLTLGVAIGATTAIYSVVDSVLLRPLPFPEPDELVTLRLNVARDGPAEDLPFSDRGFWHFYDGNRSFEKFGGYNVAQWPLASDGEPLQLEVGIMTVDAFEAIGVSPLRGRLPSAEEDVPNGPRVGLISEGLWANRYGGDPDILGRVMDLNGQQVEIIGVMPESYDFPNADIDAWLPYRLPRESENFGGHHISAVARVNDGVTMEGVQSDVSSLISRFEEAGYGPDWLTNVFTGDARIETLQEGVVGDSRQPLLIVLGTVALVLLIALGNVANLLLVRAEARSRETAVRTALGASRWRLVENILVESVLLAAIGGVLGLVIAAAGTRLLVALGPASIPRLEEVGINGGVLLFTAAVVLGSGILLGILPALRVGMDRSVDSLRDGGRSATVGRDRHRARSVLVISQVALALVLLVGSVLMVRSFQELRSVETGFRADGILTFGIALPPVRYTEPEATARFVTQLIERLEALPGVQSAGAINVLPLAGGGPVLLTQIEDFPVDPGDFPPAFPIRRASQGYFETLGLPLVEGRTFEERDHGQRLGTAIISASFKETYWPNESAIGKRLQATAAPAQIVGVVGDVRAVDLETEPEPTLYFPMLDSIGGGAYVMDVAVRTSSNPISLVPTVRQTVLDLDAALPITDVRTMGGIVDESMSRMTFTMFLIVLAALVALFLGSVGIYGVISYVVTQRTPEMGIRQALGAAPEAVRRLILKQGLTLAGIGIAVGLIATFGVGRFVSTLLYGVDSIDPVSMVGGSLIFLAVAAFASLIPAMRASRIDPAVALRDE